MDELEKKKLEDEIAYLKILIKFHNGARDTMWKGREKELQDYLDAMLDHMNELRKKLEKLDKNSKNKKT